IRFLAGCRGGHRRPTPVSTGWHHIDSGDGRLESLQLTLYPRHQLLHRGPVQIVVDVHAGADQTLAWAREDHGEPADRHHPRPAGNEGADACLVRGRHLLAYEEVTV